MNLSNIEQEIQKFRSKNTRQNWMRRILHADHRLKQNHKEENLPALHQEQFLLRKEFGPMLNQGNIYSPIMKYWRNWCIFFVIDNMCKEKIMELFNFGELKNFFRHISHIVFIGLIASGRKAWQEEEETRTDISIGTVVYPRALQGHSGSNLIDPTLQDNVIVQSNFFQYLYHVGCAINLHSIINSGLIFGGQNLNNRQTVFFLFVDPRDKKAQGSWYDRLEWTASCTIHAQSMEKTSGRSFLGRHQSCFEERIEVLSDEIERNHSSWNISSSLYSESCQDGNWSSHICKSIHVTSDSTEDPLETEKRFGFRTCSTNRRTSCATI